ncbi:MAG: sulfatase, partial [Bacteroidales bacterium]|nr:sulfatase [Bacteroidales bacterium]
SAIIYTSDHGEDLIDDRRKRFLHASPIPTAYQLYVPFIFWNSDKYRQSEALKYNSIIHNSEYVISSNEVLFHTMGDLASIRSPYLKEELSLCSPNFINKEPSYLTDHDGSIHIEKLPLKRPDRQLLVKMGFLSGNQ